MSELHCTDFPSRDELDETLATLICETLRDGLRARGEAVLAVSGGSTPRGVFRALAQRELDWSRVTITLVDDRWVHPLHDDSNERLVMECLRVDRAADACFLSLHTAAQHPSAAVGEVNERLAALGPIDVAMLGMGSDGHFASLFPESDALAAGLDLANPAACIAVDPPAAPHARMSMTLSRILDSRLLLLHSTGADKRDVLENAARDGDAAQLPIAAVLAARADMPVYWAP